MKCDPQLPTIAPAARFAASNSELLPQGLQLRLASKDGLATASGMHLCHPSQRKDVLPSPWLGKEQNQDNWILCSNGSEYTLACGRAQDEKGLILSGHAVFLSRKSRFYRVSAQQLR